MGKQTAPTPPDYTPMANASVEAAKIGADLGREQMAESRRQYELSRQTAEPVVAAQLGLMRQQQAQGDDYYNYMVANQRPVEAAMNREAMAAGSEADQNEYASRAIADTTTGFARAQAAAARQGIRYGYSPDRMAAGVAANSTNQAVAQASAANAGREQSKALGWAKKADVAGLYRGLTGASQGAYSMAMNAGTGAVGNQAGAGQRLLAGNAQGAGMIQSGMGQKLQGLSGVLSAQTSVYNTDSNNYMSGLDVGMGLIQAGASAYGAGGGGKK